MIKSLSSLYVNIKQDKVDTEYSAVLSSLIFFVLLGKVGVAIRALAPCGG